MGWGLETNSAAANFEHWTRVAHRLSCRPGIRVVSLYNRSLLIDEQLLAALRGHPAILTAKGVAFRDAHHVSGRLVRYALAHRKTLTELTLAELQQESALFADDVYRALDPEVAVERRQLIGGPSRARVQAELAALRSRLTERGLQANQVAQEFGAPG